MILETLNEHDRLPLTLWLPGSSVGGQALSARSSALQSGFHVQMLAMTSQLASDGIGEGFQALSSYFRWSVLGVKGSVPGLDSKFR